MILRATKTDIEVIDLTKSRASQLVNTMKNKGYTIKSSNTQIKPRPRILPVTSQNTTVKSATRCRRVMIFIMVTTLCIALAAFGLTMVLQFSDARQQGKVGKMVFVVGRGENRTENNCKYVSNKCEKFFVKVEKSCINFVLKRLVILSISHILALVRKASVCQIYLFLCVPFLYWHTDDIHF